MYLSSEVHRIGGGPVDLQFRFAILRDLSHKRHGLPNVVALVAANVVHLEESTAGVPIKKKSRVKQLI